MTVEHVVPLNQGGKHSEANIVPACGSCNYSKADFTIEELGWSVRPTVDVPANITFIPLAANKPQLRDSFCLFEDEWVNKRELVEAMLRWRLGKFLGTHVRASKCELVFLSSQAESFFERNHLEGHVRANFAFGLFYDNRLVSCLSVRKNFNNEWEIARFATNYEYNVRGAASRLVKAVRGYIKQPLVTFSNNRIGSGNVYQKIGFKLVQENPPSYWYTDGISRFWRWKGRKDPASGMTEKEQAVSGWLGEKLTGKKTPMYRVYDYGHRKWVLDAI
jgi:hypothetical protein